ncbi:TonB-dependent receptor [Litorivivens sp.]|uniref:TonB-dependent receptor n=1 Tax=Litorivivens sp. TaxID=2020868 RepID=UPI00356740AB
MTSSSSRKGKLGLALALLSSAAAAQQNNLTLEEVVVTAQRKAESLQDTPIALDAFGQEALEREGIGNVGDLANNVPALTIQPFPINTTTLRIYIRGIGLIDAQITQDPPVGVYVDGAYIARSAALATEISDLQRIEVLRGPQGTLYGRNSTGGAVNLITKRPDPEALQFKQNLTVGDRSLINSRTMLNVPLWEGAAAKFAYLKKGVDGYIKNTGQGGDFGDSDTEGYRFDFGWEVNDSLRVDYAYDKAEVTNTNMTYSHIRPSDPIPNPNANSGIAITNLINSGARQFYDFNRSEELPDEIHSAIPMPEAVNDISGHQLTLDWSVSETLEIKYIYAQRDLYDATPTVLATGARTDGYRLDNEPLFGFPVAPTSGATMPCAAGCVGRSIQYDGFTPDIDQEQFSHELQFSGSLFDDRVNYIAGLYYFEEEARQSPGEIGHLISAPLGSTQDGNNTNTRIEILTQARYDIENSAKAAFAQLSWRPPVLEERLNLTLGLRHSEDSRYARAFRRQMTFTVIPGDGDNKDRDNLDIGTQINDVFYDAIGDRDFEDDSYSLIAEYEVTDSVNVYAKRNEAYKSGGFNTREQITAAGAERFRQGFDPEKVIAYELGLKSRFFGGRVQLNADIFQQKFEDQQLNFSVPNAVSDTTVANAGESTLEGFELDTTWLVSENLILILNYAYLDASIAPSRNPLSGEIDDGFVFDSAPEHAYTAAVDWTLWTGGLGQRLGFNATYSYTDERNGGAQAETSTFAQDRQHDFAVLNARLGMYDLAVLDGTLDLAVWSKNLLDEDYSINNVHNLPQAGRSVMFGEPRSYGVDLIYRWGM